MRLQQLHLSESDAVDAAAKVAKKTAVMAAKCAGYLFRQMFDAVLEAGGMHVSSPGASFWDMLGSPSGGEQIPQDVVRVLESLHHCVMSQSGHNMQLVSPDVIKKCTDKLADRIANLPHDRQLSILRDYRNYLAQQKAE